MAESRLRSLDGVLSVISKGLNECEYYSPNAGDFPPGEE